MQGKQAKEKRGITQMKTEWNRYSPFQHSLRASLPISIPGAYASFILLTSLTQEI